MTVVYVIIAAIILVVIIVLLYHFWPKKKENKSSKSIVPSSKYKGLVLFDVDGTLTTGKNNEEVVQACIDNGWAVGICTAGGIYRMDNLMTFNWMPKNLWDFIHSNGNVTFNNVSSGFLMGKMNRDAYDTLKSKIPHGVDVFGYRKGFALDKTGKALGIANPDCLILCDDMTAFINGVHAYNKDLGTVCSGANCGGHLTVVAVKNAMKRCK